jgi:hypothetical protein
MTTSTTLQTTYLPFQITYFKLLQTLVILSQTMTHCYNVFWFEQPQARYVGSSINV